MSDRTFPYEIESKEGSIWVFDRDDYGTLYMYGDADSAGPAEVACGVMVDAIEREHYLWPKGSCVYHGPLRDATRESLGLHNATAPRGDSQ